MLIIVLTGTIGSGKSTVAGILRKLGAPVIDSDAVARHIIDPGTPAYQDVIAAFGPDILDVAQRIDRRQLAARVFNNKEALARLNSIVHPRVDAAVEELLAGYQQQGAKAVFVELAFLAGPSWISRAGAYWVVKVNREKALQRLEVRGLSRSQALARLANQSDPEKQIRGDLTVINNDGSLADLKGQVVKLWQKIDNENR